MCYSTKCAVLLALCYFSVSGWKFSSQADGRHDGLEAGYEKVERWSTHERHVVRNCDILLADALNRLKIDHLGIRLQSHKTFVPNLEICNNQVKSCCSSDVEEKLHLAAVETTRKALRSAAEYLNQFLSDNYLHYKEQFLGMLRAAESDTEEVLNTVYKINCKDWKSIVNDLFIDLSMYLQQHDGDVTESLTKFYNQLFPVIFQYVLNDPAVVDLDLTYRECLMEARQDMTPHPFGDSPMKLARELKESLRATRIFLSALGLGAELMNITTEFAFEHECSHALTRLEYCSLCEGLEGARSCRAFCQNIMRGCLSGLVSLERHWDLVIDHLQVLGGLMRGIWDVEEVLELFHMRVSESIMHSMETAHKYYEKILSVCGHPKTFQSHNLSDLSQPSRRLLPSFPQKVHRRQPKLHSKIEMMLRNVVASKGFLSKLPDAMCNSDHFPLDNCWNGTALGLYKRHVSPNVLAAQVADNPEMKVHLLQNPFLTSLQKKFDDLNKLLSSIMVDEEQMQSDMASIGEFEGGSGSYRYKKNDNDEDFSDDEDIDVGGSGSGGHAGYTNTKVHHPNKNIPNMPDDDIEFGGTTTHKLKPYITRSNQQPRPPGSSTGFRLTFSANLFYTSLVLPLLAVTSS